MSISKYAVGDITTRFAVRAEAGKTGGGRTMIPMKKPRRRNWREGWSTRLLLAGIAAAAFAGGCASSPWESSFDSSGVAAPELAKDAPVRIRDVPWDRLQQTLAELERERESSDVHPDDWDPARKEAAKSRLLRGLQVSEDSSGVEILGRSVFRTTDPVRPDDGSLRDFARTIGANSVIWSSSYLGRTDVVRSEPVTEWRSGSWQHWDGRRSRTHTYSESSTVWVPVVVSADERAWMAYFLREPFGETGDAPASP